MATLLASAVDPTDEQINRLRRMSMKKKNTETKKKTTFEPIEEASVTDRRLHGVRRTEEDTRRKPKYGHSKPEQMFILIRERTNERCQGLKEPIGFNPMKSNTSYRLRRIRSTKNDRPPTEDGIDSMPIHRQEEAIRITTTSEEESDEIR